jgi:O-antigen ligase
MRSLAPMMKAGPRTSGAVRLRIVAGAYAAWVLGIWIVFWLGHSKDANSLQLAVISGILPAFLQIILLGADWRGLVAPVRIWLAFLLVMLLSYVASGFDPMRAPSAGEGVIPAQWTPIVYILNTILLLAIGTLVAACPDRRLLRTIASLYCLFSIPYLIYIDLTGDMLWGRLVDNDLESNNWGLMGLSVCVTALARKFGPVSLAGFIVGAATILLASSREHVLAIAVIIPVLAALQVKHMTPSRLVLVLTGLCATLVLTMLLFDPFILNAIQYVKHDVLLLDSPNRGLDSGFTGRTTVWAETFDLWQKWPILGVGFRQHEQFLHGVPAHNAYLAMLADMGLLGLVVYVVLQATSLIASWGIEDARTRRFVVVALVGYLVLGFFDRRTINTGNPYGVLFVLCCSVALVDYSLRRAAQPRRKSIGTVSDRHSADPARLPPATAPR